MIIYIYVLYLLGVARLEWLDYPWFSNFYVRYVETSHFHHSPSSEPTRLLSEPSSVVPEIKSGRSSDQNYPLVI
jgi:hypothetical protein